jgi:hypothetical protein
MPISLSPKRSEANGLSHHFVFLVRATHDNLQRLVRQRPLQRVSLIPRRAHHRCVSGSDPQPREFKDEPFGQDGIY